MKYTYKICSKCDACGYDRNTGATCSKCGGNGLDIIPIKEEKVEENTEEKNSSDDSYTFL